jgi:X-linked retinitis pigmentosa GTPase regulator
MECSVDDSDGPQVFLLGKTYLTGNDHFYIKHDPVIHMAAGDRHSILVTKNGRAFTFGDNNAGSSKSVVCFSRTSICLGQLGLGHTNATKAVSCIKSLKFADTEEKVQLAACGRESSLVATNFGSLYAFGSNSHGQLGFESDESTAIHPSPVQIIDARSNISWKQISMGAEHSCALTDDGTVYIWGSNEDGQCGSAHEHDRITTPTVLQLDYAVSSV